VRQEGYVYAVDLTVRAWAHLVLGMAVVLVGVAVRRGQPWARIVGMLLVGLSLVWSGPRARSRRATTGRCGDEPAEQRPDRGSDRRRCADQCVGLLLRAYVGTPAADEVTDLPADEDERGGDCSR
jgi:hypothetical protein